MTKQTVARLLAALVPLVLGGCGSDCVEDSCYPLGVYIDANDDLDATSAEICVDDDCKTIEALTGPDDVFNGFNIDTWYEDRTVAIRLTVFDSAGAAIDSLTDRRKMDSSGCSCGVLYYEWKGGRLHRLS